MSIEVDLFDFLDSVAILDSLISDIYDIANQEWLCSYYGIDVSTIDQEITLDG